MDRFNLQDGQYSFPYHHIPHETSEGGISIIRSLPWGYEYLVYQRVVQQLVMELKPGSILEVGCGDGRLIGSLATPGVQCVGVDLSARAIAFAQAFFPHVDFRVADVATLPETFDVVAAVEVLEHIPDDHLATFMSATMARVRKGGHLIISVPTTCMALNRKHYRHYDLDLLLKHVKLGAHNVELESSQFVFRNSTVFAMLSKFLFNRVWSFEIHALRRVLWRMALRNVRADSTSGRHLVAAFRVL